MTDDWPGGMSASELVYYENGAFYDAEYVHIGGDTGYYAGLAASTQGEVLELAVGTGRLAIPMAQLGGRVTGVDLMPGMIEEANAKKARLLPVEQERLEFIVGDMRTIRLGRKFNKVIIAFNTLMHMTRDEDLRATFETVAIHLEDDGLFHLDLHTPHPAVNPTEDPDGRYDPQEMIDPRDGKRYVVTESNQYDARNQINEMSFFYQEVDIRGEDVGEEIERCLRLRVIFPRELDLWLHNSGFEIVEDFDDFEKTKPFSGEGGRRVLAARLNRST